MLGDYNANIPGEARKSEGWSWEVGRREEGREGGREERGREGNSEGGGEVGSNPS